MRLTYESKLVLSALNMADFDRESAIDYLRTVEYSDYRGFCRNFMTKLIEDLTLMSDNEYDKIKKEIL